MQSTTSVSTRSGMAFDDLVTAMQQHLTAVIAQNGPHLFTVDPESDLWDLYLGGLPAEDRQHHTCSACKAFIRRFGSVASINEDGTLTAALWPVDGVPAPYSAAMAAMARAVQRGRVSGVTLHEDAVWGTPETGEWTHFAVMPGETVRYQVRALTAGQAAAAKREDYGTLQRGLAEFSHETVKQALTLVSGETLYRTEKVLGPVQFLDRLYTMRESVRGTRRDNLMWLAVAGAAPGFCSPRSTMIGTLLEDITAGLDFALVSRRFAEKMHPLRYQRPQAAPAAGAIAQAEKLVEKLGIARALERRFARLDEVQTIWTPAAVANETPAGGVFGHILPKGSVPAQPLAVPAQTITWEKFARTVLPEARAIAVQVSGTMNFCGVVTAVDADAPPIIQWDTAEKRNPVSWYVYSGGSPASQWGLVDRSWVPVTGVMLQPSMWAGEGMGAHLGKGAIFILQGAKDARAAGCGLGLFPEILKADLHGVRAVIEAHSASGILSGTEDASANGLLIGTTGSPSGTIRVTSGTGTLTYVVDRWD